MDLARLDIKQASHFTLVSKHYEIKGACSQYKAEIGLYRDLVAASHMPALRVILPSTVYFLFQWLSKPILLTTICHLLHWLVVEKANTP